MPIARDRRAMTPTPLAAYLQNVPTYVPGRSLRELRREPGVPRRLIRLASNESPFGPTAPVRHAVSVAARDLAHYADERASELRQKLAVRLRVQPDEVIVTNCSSGAIGLLAHAVAVSGAVALIPEHSSMAYEVAARAAALSITTAPLAGWTVEVDALLAAVSAAPKQTLMARQRAGHELT